MSHFDNNYRGHVIYTHVSGRTCGPWTAAYSIRKVESNNSYEVILQGALPITFYSSKSSHSAAIIAAKAKLDTSLDSN